MTTPYRTDKQVLLEKKESLQEELARLRAATEHLDAMRAKQAEVAKELADIDARLQPKRSLPMLDSVKVASPCPAKWAEMVGDDVTRHCLACEKNVYNLSEMTRDAAEAFLAARMGTEVCVRFYQRADGTIMTQDCAVGVTRKRRKKIALAVAGVGAAIAAAATAVSARSSCHTMGEYQVGKMETPMQITGSAVIAPPPAPTETPKK